MGKRFVQVNYIEQKPQYKINSKPSMHVQPRTREVHGMMEGLLEAEGLFTPLNAACSTEELYSGTPSMLLALTSHNWIADTPFYRWVKV